MFAELCYLNTLWKVHLVAVKREFEVRVYTTSTKGHFFGVHCFVILLFFFILICYVDSSIVSVLVFYCFVSFFPFQKYSTLRVVSNDQTKFPKTCYFGEKKLATLSKKTMKLSNAKHCTYGNFLEIFRKFVLIAPLDFIQTPHSSSRTEPIARRRSLWSKSWRRKSTRHSPCTSLSQRLTVLPARPNSPWKSWGGCCL